MTKLSNNNNIMTKEEFLKLEYAHDNLIKEMDAKHFLEQDRIKRNFETIRDKYIEEIRLYPNGTMFLDWNNRIYEVHDFLYNSSFEQNSYEVYDLFKGEHSYVNETDITYYLTKFGKDVKLTIRELLFIWDEYIVDLVRDDYQKITIRLKECELCFNSVVGNYFVRHSGVTFGLENIKNIRK